MAISWDIEDDDLDLLMQCVKRVARKFVNFFLDCYASEQDLIMDLNAVHSNGTPIDFERLRDADDFNFLHDISGIHRHLNRETGQLENCFLPRFAQPQSATA